MAKAELKTKANDASVATFLKKVTDEGRREDCIRLVALMEDATGAPPRMWGAGIVGFGEVQLKYPSGRELDWFVCGFASRKDSLVLYGLRSEGAATEKLLGKLGKHKTGKGCVYVKKLSDIDLDVVRELLGRKSDPKSQGSRKNAKSKSSKSSKSKDKKK